MRLIYGDCLEVMPKLIEEGVKVDLILTDPPYGNIKGLTLNHTKNFKKELVDWDNKLPFDKMFEYSNDLLKKNRCCILFCNPPFSFELYMNQINNLSYIYSYVWVKNEWGNQFMVNKAPLKKTEDVMVFKKKYDINSDKELREYSKYIYDEIGLSKKKIMEKCGNQKLDHFFRFNSSQFSLPSIEGYNQLIDLFNIDSFDNYLSYEELLKLKNNESSSVFNLCGKTHKTNILRYNKIKRGSVHPTQKPVDLLEDLIKTYTNEGDTVLDFTMGSGSTGVACMNTNRKFIGIELDEKYYEIANERIKEAKIQRRLE